MPAVRAVQEAPSQFWVVSAHSQAKFPWSAPRVKLQAATLASPVGQHLPVLLEMSTLLQARAKQWTAGPLPCPRAKAPQAVVWSTLLQGAALDLVAVLNWAPGQAMKLAGLW
jgi:hypothetical protein